MAEEASGNEVEGYLLAGERTVRNQRPRTASENTTTTEISCGLGLGRRRGRVERDRQL